MLKLVVRIVTTGFLKTFNVVHGDGIRFMCIGEQGTGRSASCDPVYQATDGCASVYACNWWNSVCLSNTEVGTTVACH